MFVPAVDSTYGRPIISPQDADSMVARINHRTPYGLVYLSGQITGLDYEDATDWRVEAAIQLGHRNIGTLSPLRGKEYLRGLGKLENQYLGLHALSDPPGIITRDRWDVQRCDVMLVNVLGAERVSIGTMTEFGWADAYRRPIVLAMEEGNVHDHAFVRQLAGYILPTLEEAIDVTAALLTC